MVRETGQTRRLHDATTADDVVAYLREHPDFLAQHEDLIQHLTPPSFNHGRGVVDLQAFMVERLRDDVRRLKEQQRELIGATRANLNSLNRIHAAVLFLLDAKSFEQLIHTITTELAVLLDLDVACLLIESGSGDPPHVHNSGVRVVEPRTVIRWLGPRDVVLNNDTHGDPDIYGSAGALVRSEALIRLNVSEESPVGMLAFGSREPDTFHPGQGTELVGFLARVVERLIRTWLRQLD